MSPLIEYVPKQFSAASMDVIEAANRVLVEYEEQGYDLTLRQLYYQFVSRGWIPNTDRDYKRLGSIVNDARLAGLIDWNHIVDRTRFLRSVASWDSPGQIIRSAARGYQLDLWEEQDVRFEVWIEKDALVGVIERACSELRVPFLSCRGYTSQSEMWTAARRFTGYTYEQHAKRGVILHLGDHDPSGIDMSRDIEDRIRLFMATDYADNDRDISADGAVDWTYEWFELRRLALNWEQVEQYRPPPNPAKLSDSRGAGYVEEFGNESWELDALEPTVIGRLIEDAVYAERDVDRWAAAVAREEAQRTMLDAVAARWNDVTAFIAEKP